jgi:hypothetical protein
MKKIYKYLSPDIFKLIFRKKGFVQFKASFPKDFNDPYELFLTIKTDGIDPEVLAFYQETAGAVPQLPTLCFSNLPDVVPMWAHYSRESTGFVIELDEEQLISYFPDERIDDVNYSETATIIDVGEVVHAYTTTKPRHTYWLQGSAFNAAYFTKSKHWNYESERRFIVQKNKVKHNNGVMILHIPLHCASAIIAGPRMDRKLENQIRRFCANSNKQFYKMELGRSSMRPFFINANNHSYLFNGQQLTEARQCFDDCKEPTDDDKGQCPWCAITDEDRYEAATRNPMRLLANLGLLENYLKSASEIDAKYGDKDKGANLKTKKRQPSRRDRT